MSPIPAIIGVLVATVILIGVLSHSAEDVHSDNHRK